VKNNFLYIIAIILGCGLAACTKENLNERRLAGVWKGTTVQYITYVDNAIVKDSIVPNSGAMYLYDDDESNNQISHSLAIAPPFTETWEGTESKQKTLFGLNIRKFRKHHLELSINTWDDELNHTSMTVWYFERD
jgi:hypothetical protein